VVGVCGTVVASGPVCRAGVCGVHGFCDSKSDLCRDVDGVCRVMGNGTANSFRVCSQRPDGHLAIWKLRCQLISWGGAMSWELAAALELEP
jgi:hypothetical protein